MNYLADTVTIVRHLTSEGKIGKKAKKILTDTESGKNKIYVSVVTLFEILYLSEKNRIKVSLKDIKEKIRTSSNYEVLDLTASIVEEATKVKELEIHDRLIVASSKHLGVELLTSDRLIKKNYKSNVIWE